MNNPLRLALSGSGTRVAAHVGALTALDYLGFKPTEIAATSGGSIVAAIYAAGLNLEALRALVYAIDFSSMMGLNPIAIPLHGISTGNALLQWLLKQTHGLTFAELGIDLKIIATDIATMKEFVFSRATTPNVTIGLAARASASIPFFFEPVELTVDGVRHLLVDGGCCDNIPSDQLVTDAVPRIAVSLVADDTVLAPGWHPLPVFAGRVVDMLLASNQDYREAAGTALGVTVVRVPTGAAGSMDRHMPLAMRSDLYLAGYNATISTCKALVQHPWNK